MSVCIQKPPGNNGEQETCCDLCAAWADETSVCSCPPPPCRGELSVGLCGICINRSDVLHSSNLPLCGILVQVSKMSQWMSS
jgi:hypothetical protein